MQQYVPGEASTADYGIDPGPRSFEEPEAPINTTEPLLTDQTDPVEGIEKGEVKPTPTVEQRKYSVDWDPRRSVFSLMTSGVG